MTSLLFINLCATIFHCGCHSLFAGADRLCNIHSAGTHHCPWCAQNPAYTYIAMIAPQALISFWPAAVGWKARLAGALAAFPLFGGAAAAIYGSLTGYWIS